MRLIDVSGSPAASDRHVRAVVVADEHVRLVVVVVVAVERRVDAAGLDLDGSTALTYVWSGTPGILLVMFVHVLPPSRVSCTWPSSLPV